MLVFLVVAAPYVKQFMGPAPLSEKWREGVCLQSSPSTCGPASATTLLAMMGIPAREDELARECYSTSRGTENWYLRRAIERRGVVTRLIRVEEPVDRLPYPSVAGVKLGSAGHFVAVLGEDAEGYIIGDPMFGKLILPWARLANGRMRFTGFFLMLESGPVK